MKAIFWEQKSQENKFATWCIMLEKKNITNDWQDIMWPRKRLFTGSFCFIVNHFIAIFDASCGCTVKKMISLRTVKP